MDGHRAAEPHQVSRLVAIGDVHGAYDELVRHLRATGLVDPSLHWAGGKARLVQTGDVLDRGPAPLKALELLMRLGPEAAGSGGRVDLLLGNHEVMALCSGLGDPGSRACWLDPANGGGVTFQEWRVHAPPSGTEERSDEAFFSLFAPHGCYGRFLGRNPVALKVGDTLFCHAGLDDPRAAAPGRPEAVLRTALARRDFTHPWLCGAGPFWTRSLRPGGIMAVLKALECRRMVVGHTPQTTVRVLLDGRLINIDAGMWCGGMGGALVIEEDRLEVVAPGGVRRQLTG